MGSHQTVHIGAYIEVDLIPQMIEYSTYECRKHPETRFLDDKKRFCSECGRKLRKIEHVTEEFHHYLDMTDDESLQQLNMIGVIPEGKMFLISNLRGSSTCLSIDSDDEGIYELYDHNVYISKMYELHSKILSAIVNHKFVSRLTYKCGVIVYWN